MTQDEKYSSAPRRFLGQAREELDKRKISTAIFDEDWLPEESVQTGLNSVMALVEKLEPLLR